MRSGFTISELIVAVAATLVLILGIGRIFTITKDTVALGVASSELSELGRAMERLMRRDFEAMTRDGFLAIRNERLGRGAFGSENDRPVYLNPEQRDKNNDMGVRRLDQIVFFAAGNYNSMQFTGDRGSRNVTAPVARVWYGHGLRDPDLYNGTIGEIKNGAGPNGYQARFADDRARDGVNFYAKDWIVARQALLVTERNTRTYRGQTFQMAPSIFEFFNESSSGYFNDPRYFPRIEKYSNLGYHDPFDGSQPSRLSTGYVDIVDTNMEEVEKAITEYGSLLNHQTGSVDSDPTLIDPLAAAFGRFEQWELDKVWQGQFGIGNGAEWNPEWTVGQALRMVNAFGRIRVEPSPPATSIREQMLTHATLASACSNFEVAWSTGEAAFPSADLVWYDVDNSADPSHHGRNDPNWVAPSDPKIWQLSEYHPLGRDRNASDTRGDVPSTFFGESTAEDVYYATFGYFVPKKADTDRNDAWPWPKLIRVRMTLHDRNDRIQGGRTFEFIFRVPDARS